MVPTLDKCRVGGLTGFWGVKGSLGILQFFHPHSHTPPPMKATLQIIVVAFLFWWRVPLVRGGGGEYSYEIQGVGFLQEVRAARLDRCDV